MNIIPPEARSLLGENQHYPWVVFVMTGFVAVLEAVAVANLLFLGRELLGQESPGAIGGAFIDSIIGSYSQKTSLMILGGAFVVITTLRFFLVVIYRYLGYRWSSTVTANLHKRIMDRVISARLRLFSEHQVGEIIHGMMAAPTGATVAVDSIVLGISAIFLIGTIGIALGLISPWLLLVGVVVGLIFFVAILRPARSKVHYYQQHRYDHNVRGSEIIADVVNGIREIRVVGAEPKWVTEFSQEVETWEASRRRIQLYGLVPGLTLQTSLQIGFAGIVVASAILLSPDKLSAQLPVLAVFAYGLFRVFPAVNQLGMAWIGLAQSVPLLQAVQKWLDFPQDPLGSGTVAASHLQKGIRFERVSYSYDGGIPALDDAGFNIQAGKTTALVGASGAGKSTLIDLVLKFRAPEQGAIWLDDDNLADVDRRSWLDQIGLVRQDAFMFGDSIRTNLLAWRLGASDEELRAACREAGILDFIDTLPDGLDTTLGDRGVTVSGGERQRLAIARALLRNPRFLILDEATSALDGEVESQVLESLFNGAAARTTLIISHRLATIRNADHIIVIDRGRVIEQGTHDQLVASQGKYCTLFSSQEAGKTTIRS